MHADDATIPYEGNLTLAIYMYYHHHSFQMSEFLERIQNRFRAKNRKSKRFIKLHANKNKKVNKNLKIFTQKIFFSSFENKF